MADVFMQFNAKSLMKNKYVLFLGDSNIRAQYKDLTWLLNFNTLIHQKRLKSKLEPTFLGDKLVERSKLYYGRDFVENRLYYDTCNNTRLEFMFLTRCYNDRILNLLNEIKRKRRQVPDVIIINSCLWDLTRWGPNGVPKYKDNMVKLMRLMSQSLPKQCLVIWCMALPTAPHVRGGLIIKQIEFIEPMLRFEVMEANTFAREVVVGYGFDVLDNHYHTRMQMHRRAKDGVHYLPIPVRFMTNLLLTHIALTWDKPLPGNIQTVLLDKAIAMDMKPTEKQEVVKMPTAGIFSRINLVSPVVPRARGLKVTFNPEEFGRRCLYENEVAAASSSLVEETTSRVRSVVQLPQNNQEHQHDAGPFRRKKNKKKRKANRPYQPTTYHNLPCSSNTPSFYNPFPNSTPSFYNPYPGETDSFYYNGGYDPYANNHRNEEDYTHDEYDE